MFVYIDEILSGVQTSIFSLNFRVTALEENGGDDGNSSVAELEVRVETLEGTTADHETRISATELDINGKHFLLISRECYSRPENCKIFIKIHFQI